MFSSKKLYERLLAEKDARILDLQKQIRDLKRLIYAPQSDFPNPISTEADHVLSGAQEVQDLDHPDEIDELIKEQGLVNSERDRILGGNY